MKPLICPQCGGKIIDYKDWANFVTCGYCETKFVIEQAKPKPEEPKPAFQFQPVYKPLKESSANPTIFIAVIVSAVMLIGGIFFISVVTRKRNEPNLNFGGYSKPISTPTLSPRISPTPNPNLLEFGGKGTGDGLFQDADAIAVDSKGRIYVADNSLRVQQFDEKGKFLKVWQIPSQTKHYRRARSIQKIAVDDRDRLYVLVGGVVQMWEQNTTDLPEMSYHAAPDAMVDFALRSNGGLLMVSVNHKIETLIYMSKNEKVTRSIKGFHTDAADASMSPHETGLAAIRLAVDGAGNIFSIYALGDLGSYQLSYNEEDFMIYRFTPEAKYVNKFVRTMKSCGIAVDSQSRIYISDDNSILVYSASGESVSVILGLPGIDAFALGKKNNIYVLIGDRVIKRPAIS